MSSTVIISWIFWHFYEAPNFLLKVWRNFILFSANFFSTPLLLKTLFSPWRRYKWGYPKGFDIKKYLETITSNLLSRFLGAVCRIVLIIVGTLFQIFVVIAGAIIFLGWLALPFIVFSMLLFSLAII